MSDKDWEREMAKIDRQLASISDEALTAKRPPAQAPAPAKSRVAAPPAAAPAALPAGSKRGGIMLAARVLLALILGLGLVVWPYRADCGPYLAGYLAAAGVAVASGIWASIWTWRHRAGKAHALSLILVAFGMAAGARKVLPRIGYAYPEADRPGTWTCPADWVPQPRGGLFGRPPASPAPGTTTPGTNPTPPQGTVPQGTPPAGTTPPGG